MKILSIYTVEFQTIEYEIMAEQMKYIRLKNDNSGRLIRWNKAEERVEYWLPDKQMWDVLIGDASILQADIIEVRRNKLGSLKERRV